MFVSIAVDNRPSRRPLTRFPQDEDVTVFPLELDRKCSRVYGWFIARLPTGRDR